MSKGQPSQPKYEVPEEVKEQARKLIKDFLKERNTNVVGLAEKLNETYGRSASRTNLLNKLARASFSLTEVMQIVNAYGYEISIKKVKSTDRTSDIKQKG